MADDLFVYPASADGYDVYAEIGSGAFATVYQGKSSGYRSQTHRQTDTAAARHATADDRQAAKCRFQPTAFSLT